MSIQENVRQLAQEIFPGEGRSKGLAFALGFWEVTSNSLKCPA